MIWQVLLTPSLLSLMGGGIFVLKFVGNSSFQYNQTRSFSAPYGGVVYITSPSSGFTIESLDGITPSTAVAKRAEIYYNAVYSTTQTYIIPFGSSCTLKGTSGSNIEYMLYKYELIQS